MSEIERAERLAAYHAKCDCRASEVDRLTAERDRARAEVERMQPIINAALKARDRLQKQIDDIRRLAEAALPYPSRNYKSKTARLAADILAAIESEHQPVTTTWITAPTVHADGTEHQWQEWPAGGYLPGGRPNGIMQTSCRVCGAYRRDNGRLQILSGDTGGDQ